MRVKEVSHDRCHVWHVNNACTSVRPLQINYLFLIPLLGESTCGRAVPEVLIN